MENRVRKSDINLMYVSDESKKGDFIDSHRSKMPPTPNLIQMLKLMTHVPTWYGRSVVHIMRLSWDGRASFPSQFQKWLEKRGKGDGLAFLWWLGFCGEQACVI